MNTFIAMGFDLMTVYFCFYLTYILCDIFAEQEKKIILVQRILKIKNSNMIACYKIR